MYYHTQLYTLTAFHLWFVQVHTTHLLLSLQKSTWFSQIKAFAVDSATSHDSLKPGQVKLPLFGRDLKNI